VGIANIFPDHKTSRSYLGQITFEKKEMKPINPENEPCDNTTVLHVLPN
jgi:hypothetical protein